MKILNTKNSIRNLTSGEYIIGVENTGSHACYMIYGVLKSEDKPRLIKPGKGHEEIVLILSGRVKFNDKILEAGDSFHIVEEESCFIENIGDSEVIYIISGGHSEKGHHFSST
ncbi:MAG: hypothetical protein QMC88_08355 [Thermodesulfovibrio yellowstonii]|uniref:pirin family protein n=1 Tax=Thermodesulfovibrio yellowstonii TaxID=28262 RepID=UPI0019554678|nr:hypothetical protein [Thermodesulfovibrio islandicus]MDI6865655.1 hypothetical protein [Thermodesulfovibrio yellowstonii]